MAARAHTSAAIKAVSFAATSRPARASSKKDGQPSKLPSAGNSYLALFPRVGDDSEPLPKQPCLGGRAEIKTDGGPE